VAILAASGWALCRLLRLSPRRARRSRVGHACPPDSLWGTRRSLGTVGNLGGACSATRPRRATRPLPGVPVRAAVDALVAARFAGVQGAAVPSRHSHFTASRPSHRRR
jgi:hypothetical protein